jgi:membrane protein
MKFIHIIRSLIFRFRDDEVMALSSQLAYSFLLAFFPFLIFLMTLVGFSEISSSEVMGNLGNFLPRNAYELIEKTVSEVVDTRRGNLLSISLVFAIWSASAGFGAVIRCLNKAYDEEEKRGYIKLQVLSVLCTLGLAFMVVFTLMLLVFGEYLENYLSCCYQWSNLVRLGWHLMRYVIMMAAMILGFAVLYRYAPSRRLTWREVLPGAVVTTLGWIATSLGFAYYVNNFNNYSRLYGGIGAVIVLLTWLFISAIIILMGGELNATLAFDRQGKEKHHGKQY